MTKIVGIVDHIGPSGGVYSQGDYHIIANTQAGNGDIYVSGTNMFVRLDGPNTSDGKWEHYNKGDIRLLSSGNIVFLTPSVKKMDFKTFGEFSASGQQMVLTAKYHGGAPTIEGFYIQANNYCWIGTNNYNDNCPYNVGIFSRNNLKIASQSDSLPTDDVAQIEFNTGNIEITTIPGFRPVINASGIATLDSNWFLPRNNTSGLLGTAEVNIGASDNIYINGKNIHLNTLEGRRPTINGSGIKVSGDVKYIMAVATAGQSVSSTLTPLNWTSSVKYGITHTNGDSKFYLTSPGVYLINVILSTDYNIGGHKIDLDIHHYDGFTDNIVISYDTGTTTRNRNYSNAKYIVDTGAATDHYIEVFCATSISQSGKVWRQDSVITITKLN